MQVNKIYICDIDGTIADLSHRLHFIQGEKKDWRSFFAACPNDQPIWEVIDTIQMLASAGASIVMVSGRSDEVRSVTEDWLYRFKVPWTNLFMRKAGDHREDNVVKSEILDQILVDVNINQIVGVFDDRKQVVDMFRKRGLKVFHVAEGNF